ncbi:MAG: YbhN family protein [Chitinophagales bacterium]
MIEPPANPEIEDKKTAEEISQQFSYSRIIIIVILTLALSGYLIYSSWNKDAFNKITWTSQSGFWILCGFILIVFRHIGYMYRLRLITDNKLNWWQSFHVITLWEFSSAVTPSTVGGAAVAIYFLKKEKLSLGKSATTSMLTIFLDQVFLAVAGILFFVILGGAKMFASDAACRSQSDLPLMGMFHNMQTVYFVGYVIFLMIILLLAYGLFINARSLKGFITSVFNIPFLKKWKQDAIQTGDDIILASEELQTKDKRFWRNAFISTTFTWVSFFLIPFCIIMAFFHPTLADMPVIFSRMFAIWMIMLLPISPGGAGVAELTFSAMMCDFTDPALVATLALVWRLISYFPYLIAGVFILPRWVNRVYRK